MLVVSDTNILSSLAACEGLPLLFKLFPNTVIQIPPTVQLELQFGLERNRTYLKAVFDAITAHQLQILPLSEHEQRQMEPLPSKLNQGEREAITLTQSQNGRLLCNDKRAIRYCREQQIAVIDLADLLRLFWRRNLASQTEIVQLLEQMAQIENYVLSKADRDKIFAPPPPRQRPR